MWNYKISNSEFSKDLNFFELWNQMKLFIMLIFVGRIIEINVIITILFEILKNDFFF